MPEEEYEGRMTYVLELTAKVADVAYYSRKTWIDKEHFVPLKEDLFGKSGQLLKRSTLSNVKYIDGRWFPTKMTYKDMSTLVSDYDFNMSLEQISKICAKFGHITGETEAIAAKSTEKAIDSI